MNGDQNFSLNEPRVRSVLDRLHKKARSQLPRVARQFVANRILRRKISLSEEVRGLKDFYVCLSPKQGHFAYLTARSLRAKRIVEFGSSFGVSTIYHAAAVRDNGGGLVIGTEMEPSKVTMCVTSCRVMSPGTESAETMAVSE